MSAHLISEDDEIDRLAVSDGSRELVTNSATQAPEHGHLHPVRPHKAHRQTRQTGSQWLSLFGKQGAEADRTPPRNPLPPARQVNRKSWALSWVPYPPSQIAGLSVNRHLGSKEVCRRCTPRSGTVDPDRKLVASLVRHSLGFRLPRPGGLEVR